MPPNFLPNCNYYRCQADSIANVLGQRKGCEQSFLVCVTIAGRSLPKTQLQRYREENLAALTKLHQTFT